MTARTRPFRPMLATLAKEPVDRPGWVYEEKYDGIRLLVHRRGGEVRSFSRNLIERTGEFPAMERAVRALPGGDLVLDGELVWLDPSGVSRFELARGEAHLYAAFDCLERDGVSLL